MILSNSNMGKAHDLITLYNQLALERNQKRKKMKMKFPVYSHRYSC